MSSLSEERKNEIRQSEDYKTEKDILNPLFSAIAHPRIEQNRDFLSILEGYGASKRISWHPNLLDFKQNCKELGYKWEDAQKVSKILRGLKTARYMSREYESMSKMLAYLGLVESLGVAISDISLILLIANGKEVHTRGPMTKHVTKARQLDEIDLAYKIDFLKDEGLDFGKFIDRDVRNHVAHLRFTIQEDGRIVRRDGSPIDINAAITKFWTGVDTFMLVLEDIGFLKWFNELQVQ
jgi:hypothetical protein